MLSRADGRKRIKGIYTHKYRLVFFLLYWSWYRYSWWCPTIQIKNQDIHTDLCGHSCYMCLQTIGWISFCSTTGSSAKTTKATRLQRGRRHKKPVSNLLLQSTVKIPVEHSYRFQSITMFPHWKLGDEESKANCHNLFLYLEESPAHNRSIKGSYSETLGHELADILKRHEEL